MGQDVRLRHRVQIDFKSTWGILRPLRRGGAFGRPRKVTSVAAAKFERTAMNLFLRADGVHRPGDDFARQVQRPPLIAPLALNGGSHV